MVKIQKRNRVMFIFAAIVIFLLTVAAVQKFIVTQPAVWVVKPESTFTGYEIVDQKVCITYYITLSSSFSEDKTVKLTALFPEDVVVGLLKKESLDAPDEYLVPAKSKAGYSITFEGDFAGTDEKDNKLPKIEIAIISKE